MQTLTPKQAWRFIALAYLRRLAGEKVCVYRAKVKLPTLTSHGLCNAVHCLRNAGVIGGHDARAMYRDINDCKYLPGDGYKPWPSRTQFNRGFRAMLALLLHKETV